jgi:hexosaminidase
MLRCEIRVVPTPARMVAGEGSFELAGARVSGPLAEVAAEVLGLSLSATASGAPGTIHLARTSGDSAEGYRLVITADRIDLAADADAGLFHGLKTLRQLGTDGHVPAATIDDHPRFAYRGAMLDLARHFFGVADICRYLDAIALLKINHLHLHLTDDQGWRLEILSRPELARLGSTTQVGGGAGGFLTQDDYRAIVAHAASRFITIVPEIDLPGHTNAAIVADPTLGEAPAQPYVGVEVGFSSLAIRRESTYGFVEDVLRELAAITPGPYLHLGGDESHATSNDDFEYFVARASAIGAATGKTVIGWQEMGRSRELPSGTVGQYWGFSTAQEDAAEHARSFVEQGGRVILSPADVAYLDMKRTGDDERGLDWADGPTSLRQSYDWEPTAIVPGLTEKDILGVEAPLWTETLETIEQVEEYAFPRLAAIAEIGWSPRGTSTADGAFDDFATRVAALAALWEASGTHYWRTPEVVWRYADPFEPAAEPRERNGRD